MRVFHSGKDTLYESCDFSGERERAFLLHISMNASVSSLPPPVTFLPTYCSTEIYRLTRPFLRRSLFRRLLKAYDQVIGLEGYTVLSAHGGNLHQGEWWFKDGDRYYIMQHWIDKVDGSALALFLSACNRAHAMISATKSLVFHTDGQFSLPELQQGRVPIRLYVPGEGYVEQDRRKLKLFIQNLESRCEL
ncbi:hypothetical protein HYS50_00865 [Candidatus Woesearchaeota archaeon]|nr:hypothetical protein [Candidatus Woesearchaeota archaeon]